MEIQILPLIIVVAHLVGMLVVGAVVSKVQIKNAKDYMVAGRRMGLFMVAFSPVRQQYRRRLHHGPGPRPSATGASAPCGTSWRRPSP